MATVDEIIDRLAKEDGIYGLYRPGLGTSRTEMLEAVTTKEKTLNWLPNRKVVSGAVAGVITWAGLKYLGVDLQPDLIAALTGIAMTAISYLVPLPEAE